MNTLEEHLGQYAAYHQDRRNVATHFVGIPLIILGIVFALSTVSFSLGQSHITLAWVVSLLVCAYYFRLNFTYGLLMLILLMGACAWGAELATLNHSLWIALAAFVVGWIFQFVGHLWEGRKPAFLDDIMGLLIGPLFVLYEFLLILGLGKELKTKVDTHLMQTNKS